MEKQLSAFSYQPSGKSFSDSAFVTCSARIRGFPDS